MNKFVIVVVTTLIMLTLVLAIIGGYWHSTASEINDDLKELPNHFYIEFATESILEGVFTFLRYF